MMQLTEIHARYGISKATASRLNAAGRADGVPPPWEDPLALEAWYVDHYRSDLGSISKQTRRIPPWLDDAVSRAAFAAPSPKPPRARKGKTAPGKEIAPASVEVVAATPDPTAGKETRTKEATSAEALAFARRTISEQQALLERLPADSPARIAGMKKFVELLAQIQMAERRHVDSGRARDEFMAEAQSALRDLLGGMKRRLKIDLIVLRKPAVAAGTDGESWAAFVGEFLNISLERSCIERFGLLTGAKGDK